MPTAETLTLAVEGAAHTLEARRALTSGAPLAIVAPPHPVYGGSIGNPVVRALERALQQRGYSTLAFNFRGTGDSLGEPSASMDDALVDYLAAVRAAGEAPIDWLTGYSFGSVAALSAALACGAPRVLMVGPPLALLDPSLVTRYPGELALAVASDDEYGSVEAVRALFGAHPRLTLEVVEQAEHFFLGSAVERLSRVLERLLATHST